MRKYLNDIKVADDGVCVPSTTDRDGESERFAVFMKEREKYGFDSRETWSLDYTSSLWLYEHLMMYIEQASKIVNLEFNRFNVQLVNVDEGIWDEEDIKNLSRYISVSDPVEMTQLDALRTCCEYLKEYIWSEDDIGKIAEKHKDSKWASLIIEAVGMEKARQAFHIYAVIFPSMWW